MKKQYCSFSFFLYFLLYIILNSIFYIGTLVNTSTKISFFPIFVTIIFTSIIDLSILNLFPCKIYKSFIILAQTLLKICLSIYFKEFGSFYILERVGLAKEASSIVPVIINDLNIFMGLMIILAIIIIITISFSKNKNFFSIKNFSICVLSLIIILFTPLFFIKGVFGTEIYATNILGPINKKMEKKEFKKIAKNIDIKSYYKNRQIKSNEFTGLARGKNIIFIQCESLQNTFLNKTYNGEEITPFLNRLTKAKGTIYFNDYFELLGFGNTSDAEFVSMSSVYPTLLGQAYSVYFGKKSYALPKIAKEQGYETVAMHANTGKFYDRQKVYPNFNFTHIYLGENYEQKDKIIMGLSDKSFFNQSIGHLSDIDKTGKNFFALMVTLTTHTPFNLPKELRQIKKEAGDKTEYVYNYVNCARYTDNAIEEFFQKLDDNGILDKTIVVIYGDHHAMTMNNKESVASLERWLERKVDYDTMMNIPLIIHIPNYKENLIRDNIGSQLDLYPTILNLMGWDMSKIPTFGIDLLGNSEEVNNNAVFPQTYLLKGSFITHDKLFEYSRDGVFENSRLIDRKTRKILPTKDAKKMSTKATVTLDYSTELMEKDALNELLNNK